MGETTIQWATKVWNPFRGCIRVSDGCENCYAERQAFRFSGEGQPFEGLVRMGKSGPRWTNRGKFITEKLKDPMSWKQPPKDGSPRHRVFVNSMSDVFFEAFSFEEIAAVFGVMAACPQHDFLVLTKRPKRMREFFDWLGCATGTNLTTGARVSMRTDPITSIQICAGRYIRLKPQRLGDGPTWPLPNVWLGVSCENQETADERIPILLECPAAIRWISAEPLLGPIDLRRVQWPDSHRVDVLRGGFWTGPGQPGSVFPGFVNHSDFPATLDWAVVGGESGSKAKARACHTDWILDIVDQCRDANVPLFVKQLGSRALTYDRALELGSAWPTSLRIIDDKTMEGARWVKFKDKAGGDPMEWPETHRVRLFPKVQEAA